MSQIREGKVVRVQPHRVRVELEGEEVTAVVRGQMKSGRRRHKHVVAVGDRVRVRVEGRRGTRLEEVLPRTNRISRVDPGTPDGTIEQVLAANLDWLVVVVSVAEPVFKPRTLDRLLVLGEIREIDPLLVLNKTDLRGPGDPDPILLYEEIGYPAVRTCALTGEGCDTLRERLRGHDSLLLGPSGVGKSSLLNVLLPGANLRTGPISQATGKGVHTTTRVDCHRLPEGGTILDSPGIRSIQPWGLDEANLGDCFPEFRSIPSCYFRNCRHRDEPDCEIKSAVEAGAIDPERHDSYLRILESIQRPEWWRLSEDR